MQLLRKIKKNIYGQPQSVKAVFPPGFGVIALAEIDYILKNLWFSQKYTPNLLLLKKYIKIQNIHLFAIIEVLMRSQCLSDVQLIIFEGTIRGKFDFAKKCDEVQWEFFITEKSLVKIKITTITNKAFYENTLKESLCTRLKVPVIEFVNGEDSHEDTTIYADIYRNKLSLSISLAGSPLYKRGYRGILSASAPLREDYAACCIQKSLQWAKQIDENFSPDSVLLPFSGTGTLAFEYVQYYFNFPPAFFNRKYALQGMPLYREEHFNFLLKKAKEHCLFSATFPCPSFYCIDYSDKANSALLENSDSFKNAIQRQQLSFPSNMFMVNNVDLFKIDINEILLTAKGNIFMPLNPPYGIRFGKHSNSIMLYQKIAETINELSQQIRLNGYHLLGFILCPDEQTWSTFCKTLSYLKTETYHFTQGGIDVRVCQFFV